MLRRHLSATARYLAGLEARLKPPPPDRWGPEEQAQACRLFLAYCTRGYVERTPEGYRPLLDLAQAPECFELEPGRFAKRNATRPDLEPGSAEVAALLSDCFRLTGKHFPVHPEVATLPDPEFLEAVYAHYGQRLFDSRSEE